LDQAAQPFGPIPGSSQKPAAAASTETKPKEELAQKAGAVLASATSTAAPSAPAAQVAATKAPAGGPSAAAIAKAAAKPATAAGKIATGDVAGAIEHEQKKPAPTIKGPSGDAPDPKSKAAMLVSGSTAKAAAVTPATAKALAAAPTSAMAITGDKTLVTAVERQQKIGSVLASGAGAMAELVGPKAKAKAKAGASTSAVAKAPASAYPVAAVATGPPPVAPASVIDIVTGTPQPVLESNSNAPPAKLPAMTTSTPVGPARAYAKVAAPALRQAVAASAGGAVLVGSDGATSVAKKTVEFAAEGPSAVAVGRAIEAGVANPITFKGGKALVPIGKKFQIVFVTSEVAPFSKTGGLGEAMDGLPTALAALGHRVMVISPRYDQYKDAWDTSFWSSVNMAGKEEKVHFYHTYKQKVDYVFLDHDAFLERVEGMSGSKLYGPEWGKDYADNQARFAYFCKAALVAVKDLPLGGFPYGHQTVIVANDWHSSLLPMFVHSQRAADPSMWKDTKTAFLCHNAVFQGRFEYEEGLADVFDVPQEYIDSITFMMPLKVGKYNKKVKCINTMAAGIRYSDRALTVSPSYAREVATDPEKGVELEELFALGRVTGILNGVKEGVTPADQNFIEKTKMTCGTFTSETAVAAKAQLKAAYRAESGLPESPGPLLCFIGRLDAQKGYDLLLEALIDVLEETEIQVVIVGAGRADLVEQTKAVEKKFPSKFFYAGWMGPERYALLAGCDWTLLPSRWEPCGLVQMEAMRMGTLPIVAPTGGLRDTVADSVNGIWTDAEMTVEAEIDEESVASIARALKRVAEIHLKEPAKEAAMKRAAMAAAAEFTWSNAALQYEAIFEELGVKDLLPTSSERSVTLEVDKQVC